MEKTLRSPLELLKNSWEIFKKVWVKYLLIYLLLIAGLIVFGITIGGTLLANGIMNLANEQDFINYFFKFWPILLVGFVAFMLYSSFISLAGSKVVYSEGEGKTVSIKEALTYALHHFMFYFFISLVSGLVVILGFVLLVIPGIFALTVLSLIPVVFVLEEKHSMVALSRSRELVKGYFWPVLGRLLVLGLIAILISALSNNNNEPSVLNILSMILNFIFGIVSTAYVYSLYKDLANIKR